MNLIEVDSYHRFRLSSSCHDIHATSARLVPFQFRLTRIEYLGADRLLYGILETLFAPDQKVIAYLPATVTTALQPGECYQFAVPEPGLKFFDRTTGLRIAPPVGNVVGV
jgi:multiple sugar transport system ATP-binding protein